LDDPRLALYRVVRDPELLRSHGVFLAEGRLVVERLLGQTNYRARSVLVTPAALASLAPALSHASCPAYLVEPPVMRDLAGFSIHRGCLAIGERGTPRRLEDLAAAGGPLVVLERVGNPDNVGGAFRNAAAFGASGVVLSPGCSDPLYRKSIRTSMGAALTVPFVIAPEWPGALAGLRAAGWRVVALRPGEPTASIHVVAAHLRGSRVALLLGHEGEGLTPDAERLATDRARIPMARGTDSLNLATAAGIALYEFTRSVENP
jgi:tRNA G18 (ribose-2'-O)-methylase SpoU